ncbi:YsnF/AvaK domain-containing protein [Deinococcus roseus]|uniref:DUF2382 domain-containing protein n=1 Tax=Deinococcus roseus TaxID=392414 RepID=A0ABQ2DDQ4_9DEIO|nr:YsnF/AvaK domain-containing protein [Deinococcus roseus]GGJ54705.1 hypothetical protein GCM10008938_45980 [Deinococcus roseus]
MNNRITAVFPSQQQAQEAVNELHTLGVHESDLSFIARQADGTVTDGLVDHSNHEDGKGAARGLAVGASAGALFGLAAALIPGVGPFITAGFLASSLGAAAGGAVAGAVVGGVTGTLAGSLADAGYSHEEASYYERSLNDGGVLVAIEPPAHVTRDQVTDVVTRHQGTVQGWNGETSNSRASLGNMSDTRSDTYTDTSMRTDTRTDNRNDTNMRNDTYTDNRNAPMDSDLDEAARLRLHEERLEVDKERYVAGSVEVGKRVETRTENVDVDLEREEIVIERHPVTGERPVEGGVQLGSDRQRVRVDLEAERADVEKRAYVTEEVEVGKRTETERQTFTETVGKEVLEVNKTGDVDVRADQTATGSLRESTRDLDTELETERRNQLDRDSIEANRLNEDGTFRK